MKRLFAAALVFASGSASAQVSALDQLRGSAPAGEAITAPAIPSSQPVDWPEANISVSGSEVAQSYERFKGMDSERLIGRWKRVARVKENEKYSNKETYFAEIAESTHPLDPATRVIVWKDYPRSLAYADAYLFRLGAAGNEIVSAPVATCRADETASVLICKKADYYHVNLYVYSVYNRAAQ